MGRPALTARGSPGRPELSRHHAPWTRLRPLLTGPFPVRRENPPAVRATPDREIGPGPPRRAAPIGRDRRHLGEPRGSALRRTAPAPGYPGPPPLPLAAGESEHGTRATAERRPRERARRRSRAPSAARSTVMSRSTGRPLPVSAVTVAPSAASGTDLTTAATLDATAVLATLGTGPDGLTPAEAYRRRAEYGPNAVRTTTLGPSESSGTSCAARCWCCCSSRRWSRTCSASAPRR
jgi:hypothetical protein